MKDLTCQHSKALSEDKEMGILKMQIWGPERFHGGRRGQDILPVCLHQHVLSFFQIVRKVREAAEVSQPGCVGSGNKLQKQEKGPWSWGWGERQR